MSRNGVIRGDMKCLGLTKEIAQDRTLWRSKIKMVNHRWRASYPNVWASTLVVRVGV